MKRLLLLPAFLSLTFTLFAQNTNLKDFREVYLWDVTLSMQGYNGAPNIYDEVVKALTENIQSITNEKTEIVVIPFQDTQYCEVWKDYATEKGKEFLINKIKQYNNDKVTNTNISAPLEYVTNNILSADKIDILKLLTDGKDNVNPTRLNQILDNWCELAQEKDVFGYYILLTQEAKKDESLILKIKEICNFEVIDLENSIDQLSNIVQINAPFATSGISVNVRDEYNQPKRIEFSSYGGNIPAGYKIHFQIEDNPYVSLDETCTMTTNNTFEIHPQFKMSLEELKTEMPEKVSGISMRFKPAADMNNTKYGLTRLLNNECPFTLINKPEKSVQIYIK